LKIQVVTHRYVPLVGGSVKVSAQVIRHLQEHGHEVHVLTHRTQSNLPHEEWIDDVYVRRLSPAGISRWINIILVFRIIVYLVRHAHQYDLIQAYIIGPTGLAALIGGIITRKPVVIRVSTYGELERLNMRGSGNDWYKLLVRYILLPPFLWRTILRQASGIIALSQQIVEESQRVGLADKTVYIPNGIDPKRFYPSTVEQKQTIRQALHLPIDKFIIFCTSRLVARKRLDVLIKALPLIQKRIPSAYVVIAGGAQLQRDSVLPQLKALMKALNVEGNVLFLGEVSDVAEYLRAADIFAFPSEHEGMPNAVLEAMATRLPIVASEIGGITDLLDHESAWLLPVGDVEALAEAIVYAAENPLEAEQRAQKAYDRVLSEFTIEHTAEKYLQLYIKILQQQKDNTK